MLAGRDRQSTRNLGGHGDRQKFEWLITGEAGASIKLRLRIGDTGGETKEVKL